jgi:hypothetical protein
LPQQGGLRDRLHRQHVPRDRRFDQGVADIGAERDVVAGKQRRCRIAAEVDPLLEVPAEGLMTLRKRPVKTSVEKEAAGHALVRPAGQE